MKTSALRSLIVGSLLPVLPGWAGETAINQLSAQEKAAGWRLLFDGATLAGWRAYQKPGPPAEGWKVENGVLTCVKGVKGGNLLTSASFDDFELSWEWSMPPKSNNGVKYFVREAGSGPVGHEYQMIDDSLVAGDGLSSTASFYLIVAPNERKRVKPFGEWNHSRVLVRGNWVEHWLNGELVVSYEAGSSAILAQAAKTKFKNTPGFGAKVRGPILLTYHNDECSFRNIKVRDLRAAR